LGEEGAAGDLAGWAGLVLIHDDLRLKGQLPNRMSLIFA
jgi:hypothetical protein